MIFLPFSCSVNFGKKGKRQLTKTKLIIVHKLKLAKHVLMAHYVNMFTCLSK